jgi:outer membrane protein TolC
MVNKRHSVMKRIIFGLFLLIGNQVMSQTYTFEDCIKLAQSHHPNQGQAAMIKELLSNQLEILKSTNMPQANLNGQATWQSQVTALNISLPGVMITPPSKDQYKVTLDVSQNIYDGGVTKAQTSLLIEQANIDIIKSDVDQYPINDLVSTFYHNAILAQRQIGNLDLFVNDINNRLRQVNAAMNNGTASKGDAIKLDLRLMEIDQQKAQFKSLQDAALKSLNIISGKEIQLSQLSLDGLSEVGENINRPELKLFEAQNKLISANESMIRARYSPKVSAFGSFGFGRPGLNFLSNDFSGYFIGGVQFKVPLSHFYNKANTKELQQININKQKVDIQKKNFLQNIEVKQIQQDEEITRLKNFIEQDKMIISKRSQLKSISSVQNENGIISGTEFLNIINDENIAKQNLIIHEIQLLQAINTKKVLNGIN